MLNKSRYDRNSDLYEKVKNNDYTSHNERVVDFELDFNPSQPRKDYQEKKRLNQYFDDLDTSISDVNVKLDSLKKQDTLEMKDEVDLRSLIESAKKKQMESGGKIFTNTQHEILNSLNVESEDPIDLENIVGSNNLDFEVDENSSEFDNTVVLDDGYENEALQDTEEISEIDFDSADIIEEEGDVVKSSVFLDVDAEDTSEEYEEVEDFENLEVEEEVEEFTSDFNFDDFDEDEDEDEENEVVAKASKGLSSAIVTVILVLLIILLLVIGIVVASQYLEVF